MRLPALVALAACGGDASGPPLTATTSFVVTGQAGAGQSPLDALYMQTIDVTIAFPEVDVVHGSEGDTAECKSTVVTSYPAERTAAGASATLVQTEILDKLAWWDVRLQLCTTGRSSVVLHSEIAELNLAFGCFGIPASAMMRAGDYPRVTSFTATECSATILDVAVNRVLSSDAFSIKFETGSSPL